MSILDGLRVVEIPDSGSASVATRHLADWGATVAVLEPAGGAAIRNQTPHFEDNGERRSAAWEWWSRGKTVVEGTTAEEARTICESADLVIAEQGAVEDVLGMAAADVRGWLEGKTTCVMVSPFAVDGPYADYVVTDLGRIAMGGWMSLLGAPGREPLRPGGDLLYRVSGLVAAVGAAVALEYVRRGGAPQYVDMSEQAVVASMIVAPWLVKEMNGTELGRRGNFFPMGVMECKDGFVGCAPLTETHWETMCHWMGVSDVLDLPGARDPNYRVEHGPELYERVKPFLNKHTRMEIVETAQEWRLPSAPVETVEERLADAHLAARGFWQEVEVGGKMVRAPRVTNSIAGATPAASSRAKQSSSAPWSGPKVEPERGGQAPARPLAGLKVLDLTWFWSGPSATMLMGALGADVVKIESIQRPDPYRFTWAPPAADTFYERGPLWHDANCNKRDITLDLAQPEGMAVFEKLVAQADVVVSNFSNRVLPNLGLTVERFHELNELLIVITCPGYGMGGPWEDWIGYGVAFEQLAVCASITGYADMTPAIMGGFCDPVVGLNAVFSLLLALRLRDATGKGTSIEVPQCETLDSTWAPEHISYQLGGTLPQRAGNKHHEMAPHDAYLAAGDDEWITIAVVDDAEFRRLAEVIELSLAKDERFATLAGRKANEVELDGRVRDAVRRFDARELERALQARKVHAARIVKGATLPEDEGFKHLGFFVEVERPIVGRYHTKLWPWRFSDIDVSLISPPPLLGQHNHEVLRGLAGLSEAEIAALEDKKIIGTVPVMLGV
ncbi:MAG: CoA transferase [Dehalococcoidia bacterium]